MTFQNRLRRARKMRGLTMEQVAQQIGVAKSTYANYELSYREPNIATIRSLSEVLRTSTDFLLGITNNPDILTYETNVKFLLQNNKLNWDGIQLEEEELQSVYEFLEYTIQNRMRQPHAN